jgi:hypothetical protein
MMKLIYTSIILLICSLCSFGQKKEKTNIPQKDSNVIYVSYKKSDADVFNIIGKTLLQKGYKIRNSDSNFHNISTEMESRDNYDFDFSMNITAMDSLVIIRGDAKNAGYKFKPYYGKGKGILVPVVAFSFMYKFANQLKSSLTEGEVMFGVE